MSTSFSNKTDPAWEQEILGEPASKANQRSLVHMKSKDGRVIPRMIKSKKALSYSTSFLAQVKPPDTPIEGDVILTVRVWYRTRRPDLDISLIMDLLEKAGVYKNDRQVKEIHAYHSLDKENPRSKIRIQMLTDDLRLP